MKRLILILLTSLVLVGQTTKAPPKHKAEPKQEQPTPDPEAKWMCHIGSYHNCQCPAMVAERQDAHVAYCQTQKDYDKCIAEMPAVCDIIKDIDPKHPEHNCKRNCTKPKCQCWDGPPCEAPAVPQPLYVE